jgi:anti-sigma factor RsiW
MKTAASSIFEQTDCPGQQRLIDYLEGRLTEQETHEVEVHVSGCSFCSDALEGLMAIKDKAQIPIIVKQIHNQLRHDLQSHREKKRKQKMYVWLSALIVIILLILLVAFFAIYYSMKRERQQHTAPSTEQVTRPAR